MPLLQSPSEYRENCVIGLSRVQESDRHSNEKLDNCMANMEEQTDSCTEAWRRFGTPPTHAATPWQGILMKNERRHLFCSNVCITLLTSSVLSAVSWPRYR
jgi:hypothetical protein